MALKTTNKNRKKIAKFKADESSYQPNRLSYNRIRPTYLM
jgi:hypothetical protein